MTQNLTNFKRPNLSPTEKKDLEALCLFFKDRLQYIKLISDFEVKRFELGLGSEILLLPYFYDECGNYYSGMKRGRKYTVDELGLFQEPIYPRISLQEFWDADLPLAVHCRTHEQAQKFCLASKEVYYNERGKKVEEVISWWDLDGPETCYSNNISFSRREFYKGERYIVYEFEDIII